MIRILQQFVKLVLTICCRKHMALFPHVLFPEARFKQARCFRSGKIFSDQGIQRIAGKGLLCQQDMRAGRLLHVR